MDISIADRILYKIVADMQIAATLVDRLQLRGYTENFILVSNKLMCLSDHTYYCLSDFQVDEVYQIHDEAIGLKGYYVYALRQLANNLKGIFVAYRLKG